MASTYEPIATTTLGSATNIITFSSVPATYTDLRVVLIGRFDSELGFLPSLRLNNVSTGNFYSYTTLVGNGTAASSGRQSSQNIFEWGDFGINTITTPFLATVDIFSYTGSTFKTCLFTLSADNNGSGNVTNQVGLFRSTSAITEVNVRAQTSYAAGTTATLYGILKA